MKFLLVFTLLLLTNPPNVWNLILSKSKIEMCENRGLHGNGDPQNLVDGKSCQKKMVVLMSVNNNQVFSYFKVLTLFEHKRLIASLFFEFKLKLVIW